MLKKQKNQLKRTESGITLVALVITIIILIILSTITINAAFGEQGLIARAQQAKNLTEQATKEEQKSLNTLMKEYSNMMGENIEIPDIEEPVVNEVEPEPEPEPEPEKSEVEDAKESGKEYEETTQIEDGNGNKIVIPEGFKIAKDSGNTVQEGIVIEDVFSTNSYLRGSQFVWIPVGTFVKDDGTLSDEIILGRYTFDTRRGEPNLQQAAYTTSSMQNYIKQIFIEECVELTEYRAGVESSTFTGGTNATAYNLKAWIDSVKKNGGYYIGRYEASYVDGNIATTKLSARCDGQYESYQYRTLWNNISQVQASKISINTYKNNSKGIKSDLMNSYAWDTAIVYIQEAGHTNYSNKIGENVDDTIANTGTGQDEVCKINDLASNISEWTTEYSREMAGSVSQTCVYRGGNYEDNMCTASRDTWNSMYFGYSNIGFRLTLYIV